MARLPLSAVWLVLACGCERETSAVSGTVTYDGKRLASGFVTFYPTEQGTSRGANVVDGVYQVDDLLPGSFKVLVSTPAHYVEDPASKSGLKKVPQPTVPAKAPGNQRTVQLKAGAQTLDLDVKKPG